VPDKLRQLLAEGGTNYVDFSAEFLSENEIDLSILELLQSEHELEFCKEDLLTSKSTLSGTTVRDQVISIGSNPTLINTCVNAVTLIGTTIHLPELQTARSQAPVFPLVKITKEVDGEHREFIHLDLPGNPFPIVGSQTGRPELNEKAAAVAFALSHCDTELLQKVLECAVRYCDSRVGHRQKLREEFETLKQQQHHLELRVLVSNHGASPAYLSTFADVTLADSRGTAKLELVDDSPHGEKVNYSLLIKDSARRLADWLPEHRDELREYQNRVQSVSLGPAQTISLHFVSQDTITDATRNAVVAMQNGYTDCSLSLWQYLPRHLRHFHKFGRYVKRVGSVQKVTSLRP
jgi:hypothetical protein